MYGSSLLNTRAWLRHSAAAHTVPFVKSVVLRMEMVMVPVIASQITLILPAGAEGVALRDLPLCLVRAA